MPALTTIEKEPRPIANKTLATAPAVVLAGLSALAITLAAAAQPVTWLSNDTWLVSQTALPDGYQVCSATTGIPTEHGGQAGIVFYQGGDKNDGGFSYIDTDLEWHTAAVSLTLQVDGHTPWTTSATRSTPGKLDILFDNDDALMFMARAFRGHVLRIRSAQGERIIPLTGANQTLHAFASCSDAIANDRSPR